MIELRFSFKIRSLGVLSKYYPVINPLYLIFAAPNTLAALREIRLLCEKSLTP
jgi:hypothetical protein